MVSGKVNRNSDLWQVRARKMLTNFPPLICSLLDLLPQIIWMADKDGFQFLNKRWSEYTGSDNADLLDFLHPEDHNKTIAAWNEIIRNQKPIFEMEYRLKSKNGDYKWFLFKGILVGSDWIGTLTEQISKGIDDQQERNNLLGILAHEIRNPLATVTNGVQILYKNCLKCASKPEKLTELTQPEIIDISKKTKDTILKQTKHISAIIEDLLDISRFARGKVPLHKKILDLKTLIQNSIEYSQLIIKEKNLSLETNLTDNINIFGDKARLIQVFCNVLDNATRYTEIEGKIFITSATDGNNATISIKDNGIGLDPHFFKDIFSAFMQINKEIDRSRGGLGIGLSVVKSIIEMHEGNITAISEGLNKGTEFIITLPVV